MEIIKSMSNSELLIQYGKWYLKVNTTKSESKKDEYYNNYLVPITLELMERMDKNSQTEK